MSSISPTSTLKYGDIITLEHSGLTLRSNSTISSSLSLLPSTNISLSAFRVLPKSLNLIKSEFFSPNASASSMNEEIVQQEILNNLHHYSKLVGSPVTVGSSVELQHFITSKYLGVELEVSSKSANEFLKFKLKDHPGDNCTIQLEAVFNFQKEKSVLMNGDKVYIEVWISALNAPVFLLDFEKRVYASFEEKSRIRINIVNSYFEAEENAIFSWDYVFIKDSENNMNLAVNDGAIVFVKDVNLTNCLWRIESDGPYKLQPEQPYKIKHITQKQYLDLETNLVKRPTLFNLIISNSPIRNDNFKLILSDEPSPYSEWSLSPLNPSKSKSLKSQICSIQNIGLNNFLSINYFQLQKCYPYLQPTETDSTYFQIFKCNEEIALEVVFSHEIVCKLNEIYSEFALRKYKKLVKCLEFAQRYSQNQIFCLISENSVPGEVIRGRQDLLRDHGVFEVIIKFLCWFEAEIGGNEILGVLQPIFQLISALCKDNSENKFKTLGYSGYLKKFIGVDSCVSSCLTEVIKDYIDLHLKESSSLYELVEEHCQLFIKTKDIDLIEFLIEACVCKEVGQQTCQDLVLNLLVVPTNHLLIPSIEAESFIFDLDSKVSLEEITNLPEHTLKLSYFLKTLQLLGCLCQGRNYKCINILRNVFPTRILLKYIYDESTSDEIRAQLLTILTKTSIDIYPRFTRALPELVLANRPQGLNFKPKNNQVSPLQSLRPFNESDSKSNEIDVSADNISSELPNLKVFILDYILNSSSVSLFGLTILKVMHLMVKFNLYKGFIDENTVEKQKIKKIWRKFSKSPHFIAGSGMKNSEFQMRSKKQNILGELMASDKHKSLQKYSGGVLKLLTYNQKIDYKPSNFADDCMIELIESFLYNIDWTQQKLIKKALSGTELEQIIEKLPDLVPPINLILPKKGQKSPLKFLIQMLKIFISSSNTKVKTLILSLVMRSCFMLKETVSNLTKVVVLTETGDLSAYQWLNRNHKLIIELGEKSELWITQDLSSSNREYDHFKELLLKLLELLYENSDLDQEIVVSTSNAVSPIRQKMFFSLKIHTVLIKFITETSHKVLESRGIKELISLSFKILANIIRKNKPHQLYFSKYLNFFCRYLEHDLCQIDAICEVFKENRELCTQLEDGFLEGFIECIVNFGRQARFLKVLEAVMVVDNMGIVENQIFVINLLMNRENYKYLLYLKNSNDVIFNFESENQGDEPIEYHAILISVLSRSARGLTGIEINESKCMNIIPLMAVFELLELADNDPRFSVISIPLLNFLCDVYFETKYRSQDLLGNEEFLSIYQRNKSKINEMEQEKMEILLHLLRYYSEMYISKVEEFQSASFNYDLLIFFEEVYHNQSGFVFNTNNKRLMKDISIIITQFDLKLEFSVSDPIQHSVNSTIWIDFKKKLKTDENLKNRLKSDKNSIVDILIEANNCNCQLSELLSQLIFMIKYYKAKKISKLTVCKCIKLLITLLKDQRIGEECRAELQKLDIVKMTLQLLSEADTAHEVFNKLLKLSATLLHFPNTDIQQSFYGFFIANQVSEVFFKTLAVLLEVKPISTGDVQPDLKLHCRALIFLKLLCENHNSTLQNYVRIQDKSLISYNFIHIILRLLEKLLKVKHISFYSAISLGFETLTEFCQGPCTENQKSIIDTNFISTVSQLLSINESSPSLEVFENLLRFNYEKSKVNSLLTGWMVANLKYKAMITIHSLIEGNRDNYIISRMIRTTSIDVLKENLLYIYACYTQKFGKNYGKESFLHDESDLSSIFILETGFLIYHLLRIFQDNATEENKDIVSGILPDLDLDKGAFNYLGKDVTNLNELSEFFKPGSRGIESSTFGCCVNFFEQHTGNIEVVFTGDILCKCYFWLRPECHNLSDEIKEDFHFKADRASDKSKLVYLLSRADDIIERIQHENLVARLISNYKVISILSNTHIWKEIAFVVAIVLNILILVYYSDYPGREMDLTLSGLQNGEGIEDVFYTFEMIHLICSIMIYLFYYIKQAPVLFMKHYRENHKLQMTRVLFSIIMVHINIDTIYVGLYMSFSFLGSFYHVFCFAFHLLDFLYRFPSLQSVVYSLVLPYKSLIMVFCLILIFMYQTSIIAYLYFSEYFVKSCDGLLLCAISCFVQSTKNSGFGFFTYWNFPYQGQLRWGLFFFENSNIIVVYIVLFNILTGIIVNTFTIVRVMNEENDEDMKTKCFICGMTKDDLEEKTKRPFRYHRKYEHNEWHYIFFLLYIRKKSETDYSGIESLISREVLKGGIEWIPQGRGFKIPL